MTNDGDGNGNGGGNGNGNGGGDGGGGAVKDGRKGVVVWMEAAYAVPIVRLNQRDVRFGKPRDASPVTIVDPIKYIGTGYTRKEQRVCVCRYINEERGSFAYNLWPPPRRRRRVTTGSTSRAARESAPSARR